jgi:hypothetical protein
MPKRLFLLALLAAAAGAFFAWPRIGEVSTGKTPEYPDLQDKAYALGEARVAEGAKAAIARLPGWALKGAGKGPGGWSIQAVQTTLGFEHEVTVRVVAEGGRSVVKVRSRSRVGRIDLGQNARNVREFLSALDRELH